MGSTYTRQSSYTDGDVIQAADTNNEFDQLLAAFASETGHTHDGTAAEGGPITKLLGNTLTFGAGTAGTDVTITFDGETNDGELKWMEDEDYFEFSDDILIASTEKLQFRDTAIYINSSTDGQLDLVADTELEITAPTVDINASTAVLVSNDLKLDSDSAVLGFGADNDTTLTHTDGTGLTLNSTNKLTFGDAASFVQQSSDGVLRIDGEATVDINASTAVTVSNDLKLDSDAAVLGFGADNDVTLTHVADTGLLLNSTSVIQFNDASQKIGAPNATTLDIDATDEIELNATLVDVNANLDVSGTYTGGGLMTTGGNIVIPDAGNIGSASDTDAIAIASDGVVTLTQKLIGTELDISGDIDVDGTTNLDVTNIVGDLTVTGDTATFTSTNAEDPLIIIKDTTNDANAARLRFVKDKGAAGADDDDIGTIEFFADNDAQEQTKFALIRAEVADASDGAEGGKLRLQVASHDGEMQNGLIITDGNAEDEIDVTIGNGANSLTTIAGTLTSTGTITSNAGVVVDNITIDGTEIDLSSGDLTLDAAGDIILDADGGEVLLKDGGTTYGQLKGATSDFIIQSLVDDKDIIFKGSDAGGVVTAMTIDMSENGNIGVGTSTPTGTGWQTGAKALHINQDSTNGALLRLTSSNTDGVVGTFNNVMQIATIGADPIKFYTNGAEAMQIDSNGNVGLFSGDTAQTIDNYSGYTTLTLSNDTGGIIQFEDDGNSIAEIFNGTDHLGIGTTESGASLRFRVDQATERMRLDSSGNLELHQSKNFHFKHQAAGTIRAGISADSSDNLTFSTGSSDTTRMTIDTNGRVGIGVSPETTSNGKSLTINRTVINDDDSGSFHISQNSYFNSAWKYVENGTAEKITFASGVITFDRAASNSGGADASLTWSESMRIDASGNVGIGTAPDFPLHVSSTGVVFALNSTSGAVAQRFNENGTARFFINTLDGSNGIKFVNGDGTSERMRIDSSGNVGIGATTVDEMLHLEKSSGTTLVKTEVGGNSTVGFEIKKTGSTTSNWRIADGQTVNGKLEIHDVTDSRTIMTFDGDGRVGIGTISPDVPLLVAKTASDHTSAAITIKNTQSGGYGSILNFESMRSSSAITAASIGTEGAENYSSTDTTSSHLKFSTVGDGVLAERMRITADGNVGIGATSPLSLLDLTKTTTGNITSGTGNKGAVLTLHHEAQWENGYTGGDWLGALDFSTGDASAGEGIRASIRTTVDSYFNTNSLAFYTCNQGDATLDERMRIDQNGRVGITAAPEFSSTFSALELGTTALITPSNTNGRFVTNLYYDGAYKRKHEGASLQYEQDAAGHIWYYDSSASADSSFTQTEMLRLDSSGNLDLNLGNFVVGTSGKGIDFSATGDGSGSMSNELLDDYEEGTWTPVITPEGGSAAGITVNHATYTKIGRMVFVQFDVKITSISGNTSSAAIELTGLPYARNTTTAGGPNIGYTDLTASMTGTLALQGNSTTKYRIVNLAGTTGLNASDHLAVNTFLRGQFSYNA